MTGAAKSKIYRGAVQPSVPNQQRRNHALEGCKKLCMELGYLSEDDLTRELQGTAETACQYVDATHKQCELQTELALRENRQVYGGLLSASGLQEKANALSTAVDALSFITQNQERLLLFLQQPHNGPCLPVEQGCQQHLLQLLRMALSDSVPLKASVADIDWALEFREPSTVWTKLLQPTPQAAAIVSECHESLASVHKAIDNLGLAQIPAA